MNYKLAKQLKDLGFPQEGTDRYLKEGISKKGTSILDSDKVYYSYKPTLSELIEACGDGFMSLFKAISLYEDEEWWAGDSSSRLKTTGKTPEEAVANLYIKLNK